MERRCGAPRQGVGHQRDRPALRGATTEFCQPTADGAFRLDQTQPSPHPRAARAAGDGRSPNTGPVKGIHVVYPQHGGSVVAGPQVRPRIGLRDPAPKGLDNRIPGNAATQFYGLLNAPAQITAAQEMARAKGGLMPDISRLRAGNFYVATEGEAFRRIVAPWCLSYHPPSPLSPEEVVELAKRTP
jgi:hypothetical protein